jgi:integrase
MPTMRLWQRSNGLWYVTFYRGKHQALKTKDEIQAKLIFKKLEREYLQGRLIRLEKGELKLLGDFITEYLKTREGKVKNTYRADRFALSKFRDFYGNKPMFGLTAKRMEQFRGYLKELKYKDRSCNTIIKHIRVAIKKAMVWEYVRGNPLVELKQFKVSEEKFDFMSEEEIVRLLDAAAKHTECTEMKTAVALQVYTGMGRAEVMSALHFTEDNTIMYRRVKTGKRITVPIAEELKPYISHLKTGIQRVLHWRNPCTYSRHFEAIVKEAGLQGVTPHKLRHTFASILINGGVELKVVSELLGHTDIFTTSKFYAHLTMKKKAEAVNTIKLKASSNCTH